MIDSKPKFLAVSTDDLKTRVSDSVNDWFSNQRF